MNLDLVNQLTESRLFPTKTSLQRYDEKYFGEMIYLYTLLLMAFSKESEEFKVLRDKAIEYASNASVFRRFDNFRSVGNDLYLAAHQVLSNNKSNKKDVMKFENFDQQRLIMILIWIARGRAKDVPVSDLFRLESQLKIKDSQLKQIRRTVVQWENVANSTKVDALRKAERILRRFGLRADMLPLVRKAIKLYRKSGVRPTEEEKGLTVGKALGALAAGAAVGLGASLFATREKK